MTNNGAGYTTCANLVSAVSHYLPQLRGHFPVASRALKGWRILVPPKPHPPLTWELCCCIAVELARRGLVKYAVGVLLSFDCLLRVSELMELRASDVILTGDLRAGAVPADAKLNRTGFTGVAIRIRHAKTGVNQFVTVMNPDVAQLLALLVRGLHDEDYLLPCAAKDRAANFRCYFKAVVAKLQLDPRFVPHSCRHGKATELKLRGWTVADIAERGRWRSFASCVHYLQQGRALLLATQAPSKLRSAGLLFSKDVRSALALAQKTAG